MIPALIFFLVCHGVGPAEHFLAMAKVLVESGAEVEFIASGPAFDRIRKEGTYKVQEFSLENKNESLAYEIASLCQGAHRVMTDMGHPFNAEALKALSLQGHRPIGYYDNRESFVPGGYSAAVAKSAEQASMVVFADKAHEKSPIFANIDSPIDFRQTLKVGLGYYDLNQADTIFSSRESHALKARSDFLHHHNVEERQQKLCVYFGGNNDEYFQKAFPAFLESLIEAQRSSDLSSYVFVLQQHPGAKKKGIEARLLQRYIEGLSEPGAPKFIISSVSTEEALVVADVALYYQTSMAPLFALASIPTLQVGHCMYSDLLIRNGLIDFAGNGRDLIDSLVRLFEHPLDASVKEGVLEALGVDLEWGSTLIKTVFSLE